MSVSQRYPIFKGIQVDNLPDAQTCEFVYVLLPNKIIYRRDLDPKNRHSGECFKWTCITISCAFIFYDVCRELIYTINFPTSKTSETNNNSNLISATLVTATPASGLNNRVLTAGQGISVVDSGVANGPLTVSLSSRTLSALNSSFVTSTPSPSLPNSQVLSFGTGITITQSGNQGTQGNQGPQGALIVSTNLEGVAGVQATPTTTGSVALSLTPAVTSQIIQIPVITHTLSSSSFLTTSRPPLTLAGSSMLEGIYGVQVMEATAGGGNTFVRLNAVGTQGIEITVPFFTDQPVIFSLSETYQNLLSDVQNTPLLTTAPVPTSSSLDLLGLTAGTGISLTESSTNSSLTVSSNLTGSTGVVVTNSGSQSAISVNLSSANNGLTIQPSASNNTQIFTNTLITEPYVTWTNGINLQNNRVLTSGAGITITNSNSTPGNPNSSLAIGIDATFYSMLNTLLGAPLVTYNPSGLATKQLTPGTGILIDSTGSNVVISATQSADVRVFTTPGLASSITIPTGVDYIIVYVVGGGGGGGGTVTVSSTVSSYGGGGGGGAAVLGRILPVIGISSLSITVGAGGNGGLVNSAGNSGLASSVTGGIYMVTAAGGGGGLNGTTTTGGIGGSGGSITNQTGGAGGLGATSSPAAGLQGGAGTGDIFVSGGGGGGGGISSSSASVGGPGGGIAGVSLTGALGNGFLAGGGASPLAMIGSPGSGGASGANGSNGIVVIRTLRGN